MGLLEGIRREECRSLGLERRKRFFCQTKGSSRERKGLGGWQVAEQCKDTRSGCRPASSTAWCPKYCPCKGLSSLFWAAVGTQHGKSRQISAPEVKGWGSAIDGGTNITFLETFPGLASATRETRICWQSSEPPTLAPFSWCFHSLDGLWVVLFQTALADTQGSMTGWLGGNQIAVHLNFCLMCSDNLARVCLHRVSRGWWEKVQLPLKLSWGFREAGLLSTHELLPLTSSAYKCLRGAHVYSRVTVCLNTFLLRKHK